MKRGKLSLLLIAAPAVLVPALATAVSLALFGRDQLPDVVMLYLLGIMLVSSRLGFAASLCAGILSVAAFDFFFVPPYFTFLIAEFRHATTFAVMLLVAIVISGLTQRIRKQAAETERARREVEAEQLRSSLLSSVSHDLRTPLAVITGATGTVLQGGEGITEATRTELLTTVLEEAERLNRLIANLLDMTRLESGAVKVRKEWMPLEEVIGGALNHLESRLGSRDVLVSLPNSPLQLPCDAVLLEQVFINLVENAAKNSSGPIEIRAMTRGDEITIDVSDRGPGIPAGEEERIFVKFHRTARDGNREGVGLGLTICRAIVSAHGGKIWALNRQGGGATFRFTIPLEGIPPAAPPPEVIGIAEEPT